MDSSNNVVLGLVLAALVLLVGYIGYREFDRQRNINDTVDAVNQIMAMPAKIEAESHREAARRHAVDLARRRLAADQRCVAGVVIVAHGSTYSDLGTVGNPVKCSGGYADRPLR